ncbi:MAG: hypothetical protein WCK88_03080 [bacterium]
MSLTALANAVTLPDNSQVSGTVTVEILSSSLIQPIIAPSNAKDFSTSL